MQETAAPKPPSLLRRHLAPSTQCLLALAIFAIAAAAELAMHRLLISKSGSIQLWVGDIHSAELSQQFADWYSFSHIIHGFLFYGVIHLLTRRRWSPSFALLLAIAIEAAWEIFENTPFVINRYREATASQGYTGDTVLNSMSDILFCLFGYLLARRIPVWLTLTLIIIIEVTLALLIRDNLTLNILMLLYPIQSIKHWQMGA